MVVYVMLIDDFGMEAVDEEVAEIPVDVALADEAEGYMVTVDNFVMEVVDEEVAEVPVDVALADEAEGYMVMADNFVMEAVDEEVADIPVVAVAGEPEGYPVHLGMIEANNKSSARPQL